MKRVYVNEQWCLGCHLCEYNCAFANSGMTDMVKALKDKGTIAGGMIPKVDCCVQAISEGVTSVNIIDGRRPHVILDAFTEKLGTTIGTAQESEGIKW